MKFFALLFTFLLVLNAEDINQVPKTLPKFMQKAPQKISKVFKEHGQYFLPENADFLTLQSDFSYTNINAFDTQIKSGKFEYENGQIITADANLSLASLQKIKAISPLGIFKHKNDILFVVKNGKDLLVSGIFGGLNINENLRFENGIYLGKSFKLLHANSKIYLFGLCFEQIDADFLIAKNSVGKLNKFSTSSEIIELYGKKNLKRAKQIKSHNVYYVLDNDEKLFAFEIFDNKILGISILSPKFRTIEGIGIGSDINELREKIKISAENIKDDKISLKSEFYDMVFRAKKDGKIGQIIINWAR
ncbi:MAG: hypothetical protein K5978_08295 [Campylobacter sp.]|nr:hypothetical protein [Campylobacter sp.]